MMAAATGKVTLGAALKGAEEKANAAIAEQ